LVLPGACAGLQQRLELVRRLQRGRFRGPGAGAGLLGAADLAAGRLAYLPTRGRHGRLCRSLRH
jgi:hypothetical protein